MVKHEDERAFPVTMGDGRGGSMTNLGMSLRDYFAAKAMQGILSCFAEYKGAGDNMQSRAKLAYEVADAMLAERAK